MKLKNIILTFAVTGLASLGLATTSHAATTVTVAARTETLFTLRTLIRGLVAT